MSTPSLLFLLIHLMAIALGIAQGFTVILALYPFCYWVTAVKSTAARLVAQLRLVLLSGQDCPLE